MNQQKQGLNPFSSKMYQGITVLYYTVGLAYLMFNGIMALSDQEEHNTLLNCIFNRIPQSLPTNCETLTIQSENLGVLTSTTFMNLNVSRIQTLIISDTGITEIRRDAMLYFPMLKELDASENSIARIDSAVFESLPELTNLYLQGNRINNISKTAFQGLENLKILRLDNNQLTIVDSSFSDLINLQTLNLTFNYITEISSDTFDGITKLHDLFLAYNRLSEIPEALRDGRIQKLYLLNLRSNQLNIPLTSSDLHHDYLEELYLTNNDIPELSDDVFKYLRRLQVLHIDYNRLTNFNTWLVHHPQGLQEIKLDHNPWNCNCTNTKVWEQLGQQANLHIKEHNSTFCAMPSSKRNEVIFYFDKFCESSPLLSDAALKGIIAASAVIFTTLLITICICCCKNKCQHKMKHPESSESPERQDNEPNHEYCVNIPSPVRPKMMIPVDNGRPEERHSPLYDHPYDQPDVTINDNYLIPMGVKTK
ncbi:leucine-rich repeat transmembrane neuronal protein 4-like [Lytechinus pictus]|uniref:leucine-rich repeat transmembrane neuronal protein 4-like n=1 Tax=Lytechinus pictus TaxID=7653 RepID=UPI0030B9FF98